ncbi:MAG: hypothetical protein HC805_00960 [Alkalinema sp. RL_2_19]|nr:hypothetical protein [Alkalinema sp. RL_2_19]
MTTYQELWAKTCRVYGAFIPPTTFRRWVEDMALLEIQATYEANEVYWVIEFAQLARRFPKGSPRPKQLLHQRMHKVQQHDTAIP